MSLVAKLNELSTAMSIFGATLKSKINQYVTQAGSSENTTLFNGRTAGQIVSESQSDLENHLNDPNAHNPTPEVFDTLSKPTINTRLGAKVRGGVLPISKITVGGVCQIQYSTDGWSLITTDLSVILSGLGWVFPSVHTHQLFTTTPSLPATLSTISGDNDVYLQVELFTGALYFTITETPKAETNTCMWLGVISHDDLTVARETLLAVDVPTEMDDAPIMRIDTVRISTLARGNSIPVSDDTGTLMWT